MRWLRAAGPLLFASFLAACADDGLSPLGGVGVVEAPVLAARGEKVDGAYIVVLKQGANPREVASAANARPKHVYEAALQGFAADLSPGQLNQLRQHASVDYIEEDQVVTLDVSQDLPGGQPWGIDRIDARDLPLSGTYSYQGAGAGVFAYVIDTGIDVGHAEFGGRAYNLVDVVGGSGNDCHGHGTHVAGTIGGMTYGVAKQVYLLGIRVLDCNGAGFTSLIIAAIDWIRVNRFDPAVANLSLGGFFSTAVNTAVNNLANSGVFVAVAAGNENTNACNRSPASAPAAFTVAASTITDARASFSNYGSCVDAYAPGASIASAWIGSGNTETNTISGTSMASPHVAGVAALLKGWVGNTYSSENLGIIIKLIATPHKITGNPAGTPNLLLFKDRL